MAGPAIPVGFEPTATSLEGRCSIQLSYGIDRRKGRMFVLDFDSWANGRTANSTDPAILLDRVG